MCVVCVKQKLSKEIIYSLYGPQRQRNVLKAPGEGLILREVCSETLIEEIATDTTPYKCLFKAYNTKVQPPNVPLEWGPEIVAQQDEFARTRFIPKVVKADREQGLCVAIYPLLALLCIHPLSSKVYGMVDSNGTETI